MGYRVTELRLDSYTEASLSLTEPKAQVLAQLRAHAVPFERCAKGYRLESYLFRTDIRFSVLFVFGAEHIRRISLLPCRVASEEGYESLQQAVLRVMGRARTRTESKPGTDGSDWRYTWHYDNAVVQHILTTRFGLEEFIVIRTIREQDRRLLYLRLAEKIVRAQERGM